MKNNNIIKLSALSLAVVALWGCTNEVDYDPAAALTNAQVFFASDAASSFDLNDDQNSVTVEVSRVNTSGSLTIDVTASAMVQNGDEYDETDIFSVPATATFADGSATAPITISFDFNEIKPETDYVVTLDIAGDSLTPYGKSQQQVTIVYAPWSPWEEMDGEGVYTNGSPFSFSAFVDVEMRVSLLNPNKVQYRVPYLFADDPTVIDVDLSNNIVRVPVQVTASSSDGFPVRMCDTYTFYSSVAAGDPAPYEYNSYFDPATGLITVNMVFFILRDGGSIGWWGADNYDYLQLPGYPDYNIAMSNAGTYISEEGVEYTVLSVSKGSDVASYAISLKQGALDDEQVQAEVDAIVANTETVLYNEDRDFQFPVAEEDYYTCIAVAYGADGEPVDYSTYTFYNEINGVDWNEGWTTVTTAAEFYDVFFAGIWWSQPFSWEVEVQEMDSNPGVYRIVKPYAGNIYGEEVTRGHYYVMIDARDPEAVTVLTSFTSLGYYVMSVPGTAGKLVDGKRFVFPANSIGVFVGYNDDGSYNVIANWGEEATLLDLDPQPEAEAEPAASAVYKMNGKNNIRKEALLLYNGKKIEKKMTFIQAK